MREQMAKTIREPVQLEYVSSRGVEDQLFEVEKHPLDPEEVERVRKWIVENCVMKNTMRPRQGSSYGWKHRVERWSDDHGGHVYTSNGTFIAAAIAAGARAVRCVGPRNPNAYFNLMPNDALHVYECESWCECELCFQAHLDRKQRAS